MKGLSTTLAILLVSISVFAQQDTVWRRGGLLSLRLGFVSVLGLAGVEHHLAGETGVAGA